MAEPKPNPSHCQGCDHVCEDNYLNPDQECWNRMTAAERAAMGELIIAENQTPIDTHPVAGVIIVAPRSQ
jgi:hypothetical protein